jgi:hypothetical protein
MKVIFSSDDSQVFEAYTNELVENVAIKIIKINSLFFIPDCKVKIFENRYILLYEDKFFLERDSERFFCVVMKLQNDSLLVFLLKNKLSEEVIRYFCNLMYVGDYFHICSDCYWNKYFTFS